MTRYGMAIDTVACIGCYACTLACKVENATPNGMWLAPVILREVGAYPDVRRVAIPLLCNHCAEPPCIEACPSRAISRRADGIVLVDRHRCCGSRACTLACPYGAIHYHHGANGDRTPFDVAAAGELRVGTVQKCTFCAPRLDRGLPPACVEACPTGARIFGDLEDPGSAVSKAMATREPVTLPAVAATAPSVAYLADGIRRAGGTPADLALSPRLQRQWGVPHAAEFTLLGAGAGLFAMSRWLSPGGTLLGFEAAPLVTLLLVSLAGLILMADLGRPDRFPGAFRAWRTNWISRGAVADFLFVLLVGLAASGTGFVSRLAGLLGIPVAIVVACYPVLAMGSLRSVPAWRGPALAPKFLVDGLVAGGALVGLLGGQEAGGWAAPSALVVLAAVRAALAVRGRPAAPLAELVAAPGAAATALVSTLAVLVSSTGLAGVAAAIALGTGFLGKLALLRAGASPSPFTETGEMGGALRAGA